jgi:hypothetical protein
MGGAGGDDECGGGASTAGGTAGGRAGGRKGQRGPIGRVLGSRGGRRGEGGVEQQSNREECL